MFRFIASMVGLLLLGLGLVILGTVLLPQVNRARVELGGAATTQQQVAAESFGTTYTEEIPPDLNVNVDGEIVTTNSVGAAPEIEQEALSAISVFEASEETTLPEVVEQTSGDTITTETQVEVVPLSMNTMGGTSTTSGQGGAGTGGSYEQRTVELEYPKAFRVGGNASIRLTLKALPTGGIVAVPEIPGNALIATPLLLTDYHETHNAIFSARLTAPDLQSEMLTTMQQNAGRGEDVTWRWNVKAPQNSGTYTLTFVIDVTWEPKPNTGLTPITRSIWSQAVQIESNYVFGGITVPQASMLGTVLALIGFASQIPMVTTLFTYYMARRTTTTRRTSRSRSTSRRR